MEGFWVDCEVLVNEEFDVCLFSVDEEFIYNPDIPLPQNGKPVLIIDHVIPILRKHLEKMSYTKKAILIHNKHYKDKQQE